ncbi:hypothetical protein [Planctomyces sp. SH-PL62]|uniref:hypothetical protein n=1 Tax=Planctomyces sp. SH-PL62 TaxID=1636152 RepID=UPI00078ED1FE|nr:hypothetical protein [Planctomyces sp. SH-PL62]AMV41055.1 hypothetical protein VT85_26705 [Planctomyces sp. SH-PL62]
MFITVIERNTDGSKVYISVDSIAAVHQRGPHLALIELKTGRTIDTTQGYDAIVDMIENPAPKPSGGGGFTSKPLRM